MAAHASCDVAAGAATPAGAASRRVGLRRPSRTTLKKKARKLMRKAGGGKRPRPSLSRTKRVAAIRRKMEALRRLVPAAAPCGGEERRVDDGRLEELLLHAAGYILRLQMQVRVMQVMVHALNDDDPED